MSEQKPSHEVEGIELRDRIVSSHRSGEEYQKMCAALKVPKHIVASIILKWKKFGTNKTHPTAGRPAKLNNWERRALVREVTKNPMGSLTELPSSSVEMGEPSRRMTISAAFLVEWPLLRKRHMTARLEFAERHPKDS